MITLSGRWSYDGASQVTTVRPTGPVSVLETPLATLFKFDSDHGPVTISFPTYRAHGLIHGGTWNASKRQDWDDTRRTALVRALRIKRKLRESKARRYGVPVQVLNLLLTPAEIRRLNA